MENKIQKYLESYKRLYFKGEINNPKSKNILERKRISLELSENDVKEISLELFENFSSVIDYINDFLDLNYDGTRESLSLDEFDMEDIREFWRDMNISDIDGEKCLNFAISTYNSNELEVTEEKFINEVEINKELNSEDEHRNVNTSKIEVKVLDNDNSEYEKKYLDREMASIVPRNINQGLSTEFKGKTKEAILNEYKNIIARARTNDLEKMQIRFFNLLISYSISYESEVFAIEKREDITEENLKRIFYDCYHDFIEQFMVYIKEDGVIAFDNLPEYNLEEFFCTKNIKNYMSFINQINEELNVGSEDEFAWMPKAAVQYESAKVNATIGRKVSNYISRVINECKVERVLEDKKLVKGFKAIDSILVQMVSNLMSVGLYNIKILIDANISANMEELEIIIEGKEKAINYVNAANAINKTKEYDRYVSLIIDSLREYPYYEEAHLHILNILEVNEDERRLFLDVAYNLIMPAGETCTNINKELIEINSKLYNSSIENLKNQDVEFMKLKSICDDLKRRFKINDVSTIVRCEISTFGRVISAVDYAKVSEDLRIQLYRKEIIGLRERELDIEDKGKYVKELKEIYKINNDELVIELEMNNFGMIFSDVDFLKVDYGIRKDMFRKRIEELEYERDQELLENKIIEYKEKYRIDTKYAMNIEIAKFGRWFGELDLSDIEEEDLERFISRLSKTVMILNLTDEKKNILLNQLKEESGYSTNQFYALQSKIGNKEMSLNNEDSIEIEFIEKAMQIYKEFPKMMLEDKLLNNKDEDFHCGVFIRGFNELRDELRDEELFLLRKQNNRDGFLITSKAIYHSEWTSAVLLKDIKKILWKETSVLKSGQRYFRPYIYIVTEFEEFRFDFIGFRQIDAFIKFILKLVNTYKGLLGSEECLYEKISIASGTLSIEEMLAGNIFKEKFEGDIKNLEKVVKFINDEISLELKKLIKIQGVKSRLDGKIKNAIASYAPIDQKETPILAYDSTLFKSGKEGFLLTTKGVYCKNKFGTPWLVKHKDIKFIKLEKESLIFNDKQTTIVSIAEKQRIEFRELLEFLAYNFKE